MKLFLTVFILLSFVGAVIAQDPPPTRAREHLLGPVKSLEAGLVDYQRDQGKSVEGTRRLFQKLSFDERGNRSEAMHYQDGDILERLVYTYDVLGRNTGYDEYFALTKKALQGPRKHVYTLNADGKIVEYMVYDTGGTVADRFTYEYDAKGNKIEEVFYGWTGERHSRLVYTYDEAGHNLTQTSYNGEEVSWKTVNTYDAAGHQLEWAQYISGVLRYKRLQKYDRQGRVAEQETIEYNAPPSNLRASHAPIPGKVVYAYNERERSTEISTYDPDGSLKSKEVRTVDEKGNDTGFTLFDEKGSPKNTDILWYDKNKLVRTLSGRLLITIEYDAHGNWTKKIRSILPAGAKEAEPYSAEYRTLTYYEN